MMQYNTAVVAVGYSSWEWEVEGKAGYGCGTSTNENEGVCSFQRGEQ